MPDINKTIRINNLLAIYGELLTDTQRMIISDYYAANLSISEISQERNISRAAVEDALKKAVEKIEKFEKKLQIYAKNERLNKLVDVLSQSKDEAEREQIIAKIKKEIR